MFQMEQDALFDQLIKCLDEQITGYGELLTIVEDERTILVSASLEELQESNRVKEYQISKLRSMERRRSELFEKLCREAGFSEPVVTLASLMTKLTREEGHKLKAAQSTLRGLIGRLQEINRSNEILANNALRTLRGAMVHLKGYLGTNSTYQREGGISPGTSSGKFVSREA